MELNRQIENLIIFLRVKGAVNELEKTILDTINTLHENPFNNEKARKQIAHTGDLYPDVFAFVSAEPTTVLKNARDVTEQDLKYILNEQLKFMSLKELQENEISLSNRNFLF